MLVVLHHGNPLFQSLIFAPIVSLHFDGNTQSSKIDINFSIATILTIQSVRDKCLKALNIKWLAIKRPISQTAKSYWIFMSYLFAWAF